MPDHQYSTESPNGKPISRPGVSPPTQPARPFASENGRVGTTPSGLTRKLIAIRKALPALKKENRGPQYNYVASSQTLAAVRPLLNDHNILITPNVVGKKATPFQDRSGGNLFLTELDIDFVIEDADSGETRIIPFAGQGVDPHEKGLGKALTYAEKCLFFQIFNIQRDELDPDAHQESPPPTLGKAVTTAAPSPAPAQRAAASPPPPPVAPPRKGILQSPFEGYVKRVEPRKPGKSGKAGPIKIVAGDVEFATFRDEHGRAACDAIRAARPVRIYFEQKQNGRYVNTTVQRLEVI